MSQAAEVDLPHPIIGIRAWFLYPRRDDWILESAYPRQDEEPGLYSLTCTTSWHPGINRARCAPPFDIPTLHTVPCSKSPNILCDCGLHAYHSLEFCMHNYNDYFLGCFGIVRGWGRTLCHPDGWRAEHAEVLALIGDQPTASRGSVQFWRPPAIKYLARTFKVPIVPYGAFPAMLTEFGRPVPVKMRPLPINFYDDYSESE